MKIIVCAKQVPDTNEVRIDPVKGTLIRDGVPSILNPDDANALEAALVIKDKNPGSTVSIVSMGPPQASYMLKECIAMGADDAYLLSSRAFGGADVLYERRNADSLLGLLPALGREVLLADPARPHVEAFLEAAAETWRIDTSIDPQRPRLAIHRLTRRV